MNTLGQELRRRREELSIGLRDISEKTRIGLRFLHAIEADDYSSIPGGIYARSFIRAYAKCVNMDEDEAINLFKNQTNQSPEDEMIELQQSRDFPSEPSQTSLGLAVLVLLAVIALVGYGAVRYFKPADGVKAPVQSVSPSPPTSKPVEQPAAQQIAATSANTAQPDAAAQQAAQSDGGLLLAFIATDRSWLSVQSDENSSTQTMIIQPGESREFKADSKLKVTVGNLLGVQIKINGQPAKFPSGNGLLASNVIISKENYNDYISAAADPNYKFQKPTVVAPKPANVQTPGAAPNQNPTSTTKPPAQPNNGAPVAKPAAGGTSPVSANNGTLPAVKSSVKPSAPSKPELLIEKPPSADSRNGAAPAKPDAQKTKTEPKSAGESKTAKDSKPEDEPKKD